MKCEKVKELLPFIDDGFLGQNMVNAVKAHLEQCAECRKEYDEINFVVKMMKSAIAEYGEQPYPDLLENVQRRIIERKRAKSARKWMFSAAAAVLFAVSVSMYGLLTRTVTQPVPFEITAIEPSEEFFTYVAERYLDSYDLLELVNGVDTVDTYELDNLLLSDEYLDISVYEIFETLDTDDLADILKEGR